MTIFKKASGHKKKKSWIKTGVKKPELLLPMESYGGDHRLLV